MRHRPRAHCESAPRRRLCTLDSRRTAVAPVRAERLPARDGLFRNGTGGAISKSMATVSGSRSQNYPRSRAFSVLPSVQRQTRAASGVRHVAPGIDRRTCWTRTIARPSGSYPLHGCATSSICRRHPFDAYGGTVGLQGRKTITLSISDRVFQRHGPIPASERARPPPVACNCSSPSPRDPPAASQELDLVEPTAAHSRHVGPAGAPRILLGVETSFAAPGADDEIRRRRARVGEGLGHDPSSACASSGKMSCPPAKWPPVRRPTGWR